MPKVRLDVLLVERGLVESRNLAQRLIMAGQVRVNKQVVLKSATKVASDAQLTIEQGPPFVSRGGEKLSSALDAFPIQVNGLVCADVGASTGGFTDCLLQNGAARVYSIDVGKGVLHWKLRQDKRVVVMEGTNARYLERLPEAVDLVTMDASFISVKILLPVVRGWFPRESRLKHLKPHSENRDESPSATGHVIALIKPQFEAGRAEAGRGEGVIRDSKVHRRVLLEVLAFAQEEGYAIHGLIRSPLLGPKGNVEFLAHMVYPTMESTPLEEMVLAALSGNQ